MLQFMSKQDTSPVNMITKFKIVIVITKNLSYHSNIGLLSVLFSCFHTKLMQFSVILNS
jgi:hypothetical protein